MKRSSAILVVIVTTVILQTGLGQGYVYPFSASTSLSVESGRLYSNKKQLGDGTLFRFEIHKGFFKKTAVLNLLELGLGAQYYNKDYQGIYPYEVTIPEVWARVTKDELIDYFGFFGIRLNMPTSTLLKFYLGSRVGTHFLNRDYEWDHLEREGGYTTETFMSDNYFSRSFGYDFFGGIKVDIPRTAVGIQGEAGFSSINNVRSQRFTGSYVTLGVYLEH